jgi:hypothetical protein
MTTYTTLGACLALLGRNGDLTATTSPTMAEAATIHEGITADLNAALATGGITPPVVSPAALVSWLGTVEAWGTCAAIFKVRFQDGSGINSEGAWTFWETKYQDARKLILAGGAATLGGSPVKPSSWYTRNPDTAEDLGDQVEPGISTKMAF